jgi:hypothetical protein
MSTPPNYIHPAGTSLTLIANGDATTSIQGLISVQPPHIAYGESKNTQLASPGAVEQSSPGWGKPGDWKWVAYLIGTQYAAMLAFKAARTPGEDLQWIINGPPGGDESVGFTDVNYSWFKDIEISEAKIDDDTKLLMTCTMAMTGSDTFTSGHD